MDTKAKCRHLKKLTCKGTLQQGLSEFIDWRNSQSCWYFQPSFVNNCPSNLLSDSPPSSLPCVKVEYMLAVCGWWGCWVGLESSSLATKYVLCELNTLHLTRFRTYEIATPPQQKPRRGGGLCRKVPLQINFLEDDILHCFLSVYNLSTYGKKEPSIGRR
jgi:hypothetical protein